MAKGLAYKRHEMNKAKARAVKHFKQVFFTDQTWWNTPKTIGKHAVTTSRCGRPGCKACSASGMFSYTKDWHDSKVFYIDE